MPARCKARDRMITLTTLRSGAASAAVLLLVACNNAPVTNTVAPADPMADNVVASTVELPPAVQSSKSYRCDDNSVVIVDLFQGDKQANGRDTKTSPATTLRAANAGEPLVAEGFEIVRSGEALTVTRPGRPKQKCAA